jgi:hypothetical protein
MEAVGMEEIIARQPPEAQAIIRLLLARIAELEARVGDLTARIGISLLKQHPLNDSIKGKSQIAGWDEAFLMQGVAAKAT